MINLLTIDLEEYFQVSGLSDVAQKENWGGFDSRVEDNVSKLTDILGETKATFFVLGWIAKKFPELVRKISDAGHEIASHGKDHRLINSMTEKEFSADLSDSIKLLEDLTDMPVLGFRAPSFSITEDTFWAFEAMAGLGMKYDSSVFPVKRRRGGIEGTEKKLYKIKTSKGSIIEFPLPVWNFFGKNIPFGGGGFLRMYPYWLTKTITKNINEQGRSAVVYLHPWEIDPLQPRLKNKLTRNGFNHYVGLKTTIKKLQKMLEDFKFTSIRDYLKDHPELMNS